MATPRKESYTVFCVEVGCRRFSGRVQGPGRRPLRCLEHHQEHRRKASMMSKRRARFNERHSMARAERVLAESPGESVQLAIPLP